MPRGDKDKYTDKQKRQAEHIAEGYEDRGVSKKVAKSRAWATVNKEDGGGNLSGSGRDEPDSNASSRRGGKRAAAKRAKAKSGTKKRAGTKRTTSTKRAGTRKATKRAGTKRTKATKRAATRKATKKR